MSKSILVDAGIQHSDQIFEVPIRKEKSMPNLKSKAVMSGHKGQPTQA